MREGDREVMLSYKGYTGKVEVDADSGMLSGCVLNLRDVVAYHGASFEELERDFRGAIDDYLEYCRELRKNPDKPF